MKRDQVLSMILAVVLGSLLPGDLATIKKQLQNPDDRPAALMAISILVGGGILLYLAADK